MSNDSEAVRLFKISADQGNADAQFELGLLYRFGSRGLTEDWPEAERLFKRAARQEHIRARQFLESNAPRMPLAKWLYTRGRWPNSWVESITKALIGGN